MVQRLLQGHPPIAVELRRSARARRITLRVSQTDGRVTLTMPRSVPEAEALDFARARESWIRGHLAQMAPVEQIGPGSRIPIEGTPHEIHPGSGRAVQQRDGTVLVPGAEARIGARLSGWLKVRARDRLSDAADRYAARVGRSYAALVLRDTRSRWGSCSDAGRLMFSWRLILAPPEVLDYVAAHEVAHLAEMNHGQAFWDTVQRIHGPYHAPRGWLRRHGAGLHRYRFDD